jgi:hypothetical protein
LMKSMLLLAFEVSDLESNILCFLVVIGVLVDTGGSRLKIPVRLKLKTPQIKFYTYYNKYYCLVQYIYNENHLPLIFWK